MAVVGSATRNDPAVGAAAFFAAPAGVGDDKIHFDQAFRQRLAHFHGAPAGNVFLVGLKITGRLFHDLLPGKGQHVGPFLKAPLCGGEGAVEIGFGGMGNLAENFVGCRVDDIFGLARGSDGPLTVNQHFQFCVAHRHYILSSGRPQCSHGFSKPLNAP